MGWFILPTSENPLCCYPLSGGFLLPSWGFSSTLFSAVLFCSRVLVRLKGSTCAPLASPFLFPPIDAPEELELRQVFGFYGDIVSLEHIDEAD